MRQAGRYRGTGKPTLANALRVREIGRDPIPRKAFWPAAHARRISRSNTWPHRPALQKHSNPLAKGAPSTHGENPGFVRSLLGIGGVAPYGDDPSDNMWISRGFNYYQSYVSSSSGGGGGGW